MFSFRCSAVPPLRPFRSGWRAVLATGQPSVKPCNQNIRETLALAERMLALADRGDAEREDVGCGILYGILRDAAYKIRKAAEAERQNHMEKGWWGGGA